MKGCSYFVNVAVLTLCIGLSTTLDPITNNVASPLEPHTSSQKIPPLLDSTNNEGNNPEGCVTSEPDFGGIEVDDQRQVLPMAAKSDSNDVDKEEMI